MTINLLQGLEAPAGNVSKVSITDLLGMEIADIDLVAIDDNGDLSIQYGDTGEFKIDEIDFGTWERKTFDPINVTFPLSRINLSGIPQSGISLSYSEYIIKHLVFLFSLFYMPIKHKLIKLML